MSGCPPSRTAGATTLLALLLTVLALIRAWQAASPLGDDFYLHWCVAHSITDTTVGKVYSEDGRQKIGELCRDRFATTGGTGRSVMQQLTSAHPEPQTVATPMLYWTFAAWISEDYQHDYLCYRVLNLLCTILAVSIFARILGFSLAAALLAICVLTEAFEPFLSIQRTGNVSQLQLGALALFLLVQGGSTSILRGFLGGAILGAAVAFKPNLVVPLGLLLAVRLSRRQVSSAVSLAIGAIASAATAVVFSARAFAQPNAWLNWHSELQDFLDAPPSVEQGNYALANLFEAAAGVHVSAGLLGGLGLGLIALLWLRARRNRGIEFDRDTCRHDDLLVLSLGCAVTLLSAPIAWLHYYNLILPLALFCLWPPRRGSVGLAAHWPRGLLVATCVFSLALRPAILLLDAELQSPALYAQLCYWPTVILLLLGCSELLRVGGEPKPDDEPSPATLES